MTKFSFSDPIEFEIETDQIGNFNQLSCDLEISGDWRDKNISGTKKKYDNNVKKTL